VNWDAMEYWRSNTVNGGVIKMIKLFTPAMIGTDDRIFVTEVYICYNDQST
jgi:hypothetical protein